MNHHLPRPQIAYRAFVISDSGHIQDVASVIEAEGDREAVQQAEVLAAEQAIELWDGARLVARIKRRQSAGQPDEAEQKLVAHSTGGISVWVDHLHQMPPVDHIETSTQETR